MEKDIDKLIDYYTKHETEIPKLITQLVNLLGDNDLTEAVSRLLKGEK